MRFFDVGQEAVGVIAIGQHAMGVIAFGQLAVGFIAVGQVARGVFVVGQLAVGVVAVGQLALGVHTAIGMLAIGGRRSGGLGFAFFPKPEKPKDLPEPVELESIERGKADWVEARFEKGPGGSVQVEVDRKSPPIDLGPKILAAAQRLAAAPWNRAFLHVMHDERLVPSDGQDASYRSAPETETVYLADRLQPIPEPRHRDKRFWIGVAVKLPFFLALVAGWILVAGGPVWNLILPDSLGVDLPMVADF